MLKMYTNNKTLLELVARHIDNPVLWHHFSKAGPTFKHVCDKLLDRDEMDYKKITIWGQTHKQAGTLDHRKLRDGTKHGPETAGSLYYSYYRNGKLHGREWEKTKHRFPPNDRFNGDFLEYECDWKNGVRDGWEVRYWGKGWGHYMIMHKKGIQHGFAICYSDSEETHNMPYGFQVWDNGKRLFEKEYFDELVHN